MKAWTIQGSLNIECVLERNEESIIKHSGQMAIWSLLLLLQGGQLGSRAAPWRLTHVEVGAEGSWLWPLDCRGPPEGVADPLPEA